MNRSSNATYATPGWRGTDPDGGTWIANDDGWWIHFPAGGGYRQMTWRSQEEAEAASLVPLVAETAVRELCEAIRLTAEYVGPKILPAVEGWLWFDALVKYAPESAQVFMQAGWGHLSPAAVPAPLDLRQVATAEELDTLPDSAVVVDADDSAWQRNGHIDCVPMWDRSGESERRTSGEIPLPALVVWIPGAADPAPLDPGNPEHLRQVREFLGHVGMRNGYPTQAMETVRNDLGHEADRLDREHAEAEKEKADRELAIAKFTEAIPGFDPDSEYGMRVVDAALTVLRERQEAGQS